MKLWIIASIILGIITLILAVLLVFGSEKMTLIAQNLERQDMGFLEPAQFYNLSQKTSDTKWQFETLTFEEDTNNDGTPDITSTFTAINDTMIEIFVNDSIEKGSYKWSSAVCNISNVNEIQKMEYNLATKTWTNTGGLNHDLLIYYELPSTWCESTNGRGFNLFGAGSGDKRYRLIFPSGYKEIEVFTGKGSEIVSAIYQDINLINYQSGWFNINITLFKEINGEYNNTINDLFVLTDTIMKFGANDSNNFNFSNYKYVIESDVSIKYDKGFKYYLNNYPAPNQEERHYFNFEDICERNFTTNCNFNQYETEDHNFLEITFISDMFIDPTITITNYTSYGMIKYNSTEESRPIIHETINDSSLIFYLPLDIPSSSKVYDYSTNNNEGTVTNAIWNSNGRFGGGYEFDGKGDYIDLGEPTELDLTENYTISLWMRGVEATFSNSITKRGDPVLDDEFSQFEMHYDGRSSFAQKIIFSIGNGTDEDQVSSPDDSVLINTWTHIACGVNATNIYCYVDGDFSSAQPLTIKGRVGKNNTYIGTAVVPTNSYAFNGSIDEVMIFNRSLNSSEITQIYNMQYQRFYQPSTAHLVGNFTDGFDTLNVSLLSAQGTNYSDLFWEDSINGTIDPNVILWYHLDNRSGYENDTHVFDWSGNQNNGSICSNATPISSGKYQGGFEFDGAEDSGSYCGTDVIRIQASNDDGLNLESDFSISMWYYLKSSAGDNSLFGKGKAFLPANNDKQVTIYFDSSERPRMQLGNDTDSCSSTVTSLPAQDTNVWEHIVVTVNSSKYATTYLNGDVYITVDCNTLTGTYLADNTTTLGSVSYDGDSIFNGTIDEVMIFNRALNSQEVISLHMASNRFIQNKPSNITLSASLFNGTYDDAIDGNIDDDIMVWYHLDNRSGYENNTHVYDWSGNGNNGTITSAVFNSTGRFAGAYEFDGVDDSSYIDFGDNNALDSFPNGFTLMGWARPNILNANKKTIASKLTMSTSRNGYALTITNNDATFEIANATANSQSTTTNDVTTNWQHYAGVFNGSHHMVYVNGILASTPTFTSPNFQVASLTEFYIGATYRNGVTWRWVMNGSIDEVMLYNRTLTEEEIRNIYAGSKLKFITETNNISVNEGYQTVQLNFSSNVTGIPILNIYMNDEYYSPTIFDDILLTTWNRTTVSEGPTDNEYPIFYNISELPANGTQVDNGHLNISVNINSTNGTAGWEFDGINYTLSNTSNWFNATNSSLGGGVYSYYFWGYGNGTDENYNTTQLYYYTINITPVVDNEYPRFSNYVDDPDSWSFSQAYQYNVTVVSTNGTVGIEFNEVNYSTTNLSTVFSMVRNDIEAGSYNWYAWGYGNGTDENYNASNLQTHTIAQATPVLSLSCPSPIEYEEQGTCTGTETNNGDGDLVYTLYRENVSVSNPDTTVLGAGTYNYVYNTSGGNNYTTGTDSDLLTVNQNTSFVLGISGTSPITYGTVTDVAGSDCPAQLTCNLDKANAVYGAGTETFNYSTAGNNNYSTDSITIDITINQANGEVNLTINGSNSGITISPGIALNLNATIQTGDTGYLVIYNNGTLINNGTNPIGNLTNFTTEGVFNISARYEGSNNYTSDWAQYDVTVTSAPDTTQPYFNPIPGNNETTYGTGFWQDIDATDDIGIDGYFVNDTRFTINRSTGMLTNASQLGAGVYNINISVNDTSGNLNSTLIYLNVSQATSEIATYLHGTRSGVSTTNNTQNYNLSTQLITGTSGNNIRLWINGSLWNTGSGWIYNLSNLSTWGLVTINITGEYFGNNNYTNDNETWELTITEYTAPTPSSTNATVCRYASFGYYNLNIPAMWETGCV